MALGANERMSKRSKRPPVEQGGIWFKCRGCGALAGYYPNGAHEWPGGEPGQQVPRGSCVHTKPVADNNRKPVQCTLFRQLEPAEFWLLHKDDPREAGPSKITAHSDA